MGAPIKADELFAAWSRRQWKSIYLFSGQEDFLIEDAVRQATEHWLGKVSDSLNLDRFDGESHSPGEILQAACTMPFLGTARLVRVDNASKFSAADQEILADGFKSLPQETHLLFIWGKEWRREDARKPLVEAIQDSGQVVIFWPLFPEHAIRWLIQRGKLYQKNISPEAASWLVQQTGESLRLLDQELAKCSAYTGGRPTIELEDMQASFGYHKASSPFEWLQYIRQKQDAHAVKVLGMLLEEGEEPLRLLFLLSRTFRDWLSAKHSGENAFVLGMRFHIKRGEENRFLQELARWSDEELTEGIGRCLQAEQSIKTGKETPEMALTLLTLSFSRFEPADVLR